MIFLADIWNRKGSLLKYSLEKAGLPFRTVCVLYDGWLPDDVVSPYQYYIEQDSPGEEAGISGRPLFFDELQVPRNWEIEGTNTSGKVLDYHTERARIFYADPKNRRNIKIVDWLDAEGRVRFSDHYDRFGCRIAQTVVSDNRMVMKIWFDRSGHEVILENFVTGTIVLRDRDGEHVFAGRPEFVLYYLREAGYDRERVFYNSLSTPYAVVQEMGQRSAAQPDILFWQEPIRDTIPGNMKKILNGRENAVIAVQTREDYEKLRKKIQDREVYGKDIQNPERADRMIRPVGFVYPYEQNHEKEGAGEVPQHSSGAFRGSVLTVTNSDQVASLEELLKALPGVRFDVAALTEMSAKLTALEHYPNLYLHPACSEGQIIQLFHQASAYLDINYGDEVLDSVYRAFLHEIPILAFEATSHSRIFTAVRSVIPSAKGAGRMAAAIQRALFDEDTRARMIREQKSCAMDETPESFRKAIGLVPQESGEATRNE